jgi:hypothetical protein
MVRYLAVFLALVACFPTAAQSTDSLEHREFELAPVAPTRPALKYQLVYDDLADLLPGNAAILYLDAILLMGSDARAKIDRAQEADTKGDSKAFNSLADELELHSVMQELELAARRTECDWQPPYRELGAFTLLPHLEPLAKGIGRFLWVRSKRQINSGKIEESLKTIRIGYELSNDVGREPVVVSGLVSLAIAGQMNDCIAELMSHPDAPNLYWALREIHPRQLIFRHALDGERAWIVTSAPHLMKLRSGALLSADEWRELIEYAWSIHESSPAEGLTRPDPIDSANAETLRQARSAYADAHQMTAADVAELEPIVVLGDFYYRQYQELFDEQYKLRGLPYPILLTLMRDLTERSEPLFREQPGNPFRVFGMEKVVERFARSDRELAALVAVESLRSYAAEHDGRLPEKLSDVVATPVPDNPATGKPFEYHLHGETATLGDTEFEPALKYTVKTRK